MPTEAEEAAAHKKMRDEQEKNNHKQMEELAKHKPTPSVEEMNKAAALVNVEEPAKLEPEKVEKKSEPEPQAQAGDYKTRDVTPKKG